MGGTLKRALQLIEVIHFVVVVPRTQTPSEGISRPVIIYFSPFHSIPKIN